MEHFVLGFAILIRVVFFTLPCGLFCRGSPLRRRRSWGFVTPSFLSAVSLKWTLGKFWQSTMVKKQPPPPQNLRQIWVVTRLLLPIFGFKLCLYPSCSVWDHPGLLGEGQLAGGLLHCAASKERSCSCRPEWNSHSGKRGPRIWLWLWPRNSRANWGKKKVNVKWTKRNRVRTSEDWIIHREATRWRQIFQFKNSRFFKYTFFFHTIYWKFYLAPPVLINNLVQRLIEKWAKA